MQLLKSVPPINVQAGETYIVFNRNKGRFADGRELLDAGINEREQFYEYHAEPVLRIEDVFKGVGQGHYFGSVMEGYFVFPLLGDFLPIPVTRSLIRVKWLSNEDITNNATIVPVDFKDMAGLIHQSTPLEVVLHPAMPTDRDMPFTRTLDVTDITRRTMVLRRQITRQEQGTISWLDMSDADVADLLDSGYPDPLLTKLEQIPDERSVRLPSAIVASFDFEERWVKTYVWHWYPNHVAKELLRRRIRMIENGVTA